MKRIRVQFDTERIDAIYQNRVVKEPDFQKHELVQDLVNKLSGVLKSQYTITSFLTGGLVVCFTKNGDSEVSIKEVEELLSQSHLLKSVILKIELESL